LIQNIVVDVLPKNPSRFYVLNVEGSLKKNLSFGTSRFFITINGTSFHYNETFLPENHHYYNKGTNIVIQSNETLPDLNGDYVMRNELFSKHNERIMCMEYYVEV
jgi:hypothetical protein